MLFGTLSIKVLNQSQHTKEDKQTKHHKKLVD